MAAHTNVCVIGLGSMGMGAARACLQAGLNTWGVDINPDNCRALLAAGAKGAGPSAVPFAAELDAVVLLVVNAAQVRGILFGESGLAAHLKPGTVVMVSSTIASADAQAIAEALAEYQLLMLDAPVSGGAVKAAAGDMTVMASGSDAAFARLAPVLDAVAGKVYRIGSDIGLGSTVKIIHQLLPGCTSPLPPKRWRLPPAPGSHWKRCMTWSPTRRVIPGCLRIACSTSWMAITRQNPLSIFLSKISGW